MWGELSLGKFYVGRVVLGRVIFKASCTALLKAYPSINIKHLPIYEQIGKFIRRQLVDKFFFFFFFFLQKIGFDISSKLET